MATCETTHWTLDCGAGHACYLVEYSDNGELAGWGCNSDPVKGRPKPRKDRPVKLAAEERVEFCCTDMTIEGLAQALGDMVAVSLSVPTDRAKDPVTYCAKGSVRDVVKAIGLS